ncbi:aminotransferase class I/II-fold pyridoxal phosphate-dependent enzyme [Bradyrhizobium sp. 521_C7_N1_3]|uniref:aminotransferase class I/II-fold pyridoxal phosphate-dependent enzyme n=1 Tax=Bradyrhizobium sp. 521_C7_N1_3 TaxID=3240368 RepID=UPI003F8B625B
MQQQIAQNNGYRLGVSHLHAAQIAGLVPVQGHASSGRTIACLNGRRYGHARLIDFARCSYLGLHDHPVIVAGAIEAIEAHRSLHQSYTRTRLDELEESLSDLFGSRVIAFSSGMLANLGAMPILASGQFTGGRRPVVAFDQSAHISLAHHKPVVANETALETIAHNDINALERLCREHSVVAYVCDGVYFRGGYAPIKELRQLQERYGLFLYIDDAHGISLFGRQGEGFARSQFSQALGDRTVIAGSLAKGFGSSGGVLMVGLADHEALIRKSSIPYSFSAAPSAAAIGAALASCKIHRSPELGQRQRRLSQLTQLFDRGVATAEQGNSLPIRTIVIGSEVNATAIARRLLDCGFYTLVDVQTVAQGRAAIRVCITAEQEFCDVERLCDCILEITAEVTGKPYPMR